MQKMQIEKLLIDKDNQIASLNEKFNKIESNKKKLELDYSNLMENFQKLQKTIDNMEPKEVETSKIEL
jgi:septation ring formation regulator EzrA